MNEQQFIAALQKQTKSNPKLATLAGIGQSQTQTVLDKLITCYQPMIDIKERVAKLAPHNISVLILGETGTGKELIAEALHGSRPGKFVPVNCAGIPDTLLESEFFGCVKGAYTGAVSDRDGYVTEAKDGTLFLDEIGDMPLLLQSKLLRMLQSKRFRRVGSVKEEECYFRLVSATNQLESTKQLRLDLYYRLAGTTINLPNLEDRGTDDKFLIIETLVNNPTVIKYLLGNNYHKQFYPGNIRQLLNIIEEAKILYAT